MKKYVVMGHFFIEVGEVCTDIRDERVFDTLEGAIDFATKITCLSNPIIYEAKCALQTIREDKVVWDSVEIKREIPVIEILRTMKKKKYAVKKPITKEELVAILKENFSTENGNIKCNDLYFGKGVSVELYGMKIDGDLRVSGAEVNGDVFQGMHSVRGSVYQYQHEVSGNLYQGYQKVGGTILQAGHFTQNRIRQDEQTTKTEKITKEELAETSTINHPTHYNTSKIECIDYIEDIGFGEGFNLGNAIKYIVRAKHKNNHIDDLQKAKWYIERELERLKGE